jgi:hypothetical protein
MDITVDQIEYNNGIQEGLTAGTKLNEGSFQVIRGNSREQAEQEVRYTCIAFLLLDEANVDRIIEVNSTSIRVRVLQEHKPNRRFGQVGGISYIPNARGFDWPNFSCFGARSRDTVAVQAAYISRIQDSIIQARCLLAGNGCSIVCKDVYSKQEEEHMIRDVCTVIWMLNPANATRINHIEPGAISVVAMREYQPSTGIHVYNRLSSKPTQSNWLSSCF